MDHEQTNDLIKALPHGPEFRFIDSITELEPGVSATATYSISGSESFLPGHFPGNPIWPGVIMAEAIAQLGGIVAHSDESTETPDGLLLTAVQQFKILGTAAPPAQLTISARIDARMGPLIQVRGSVSLGDATLAKGKITLSGAS